ncbi:MAG: hydantoinase/oxoprolinase family protein, partial [Alphaproteobacteria bacterium]|nr:hydantoinase/oxoprolinase family protein [Alphaproteobacteria bacterium]
TLSTPNNPTKAIQDGLQLISEDLEISPDDIISQSDLCINGTTVGLNALIQHEGSPVGLICTEGHEDSIEIRLGHKEDGYRYDPDYPPAVMLSPRYLRKGIRARMLSNGKIKIPINKEDVREACKIFVDEGVNSIAISFIWSVLNPSHEIIAEKIVREMMPNAFITVGSRLYPQIREYTRTSTAVTNAYLSPTLKSYVSAINEYFISLGGENNVRYFQSNGGLATGEVMTDRSVYAINSGPASAPIAGLSIANPFKYKNVITVDMGGTSFDITLTKGGSTNLNKNVDFLRYRIGVPMIHVETLGAGGGSIAWIDEMGLLQVGPQSAGANPGPACYSKGGEKPTVSDANLVLGYLNPDGLIGGKLPLNYENAFSSIEKNIAKPLGMEVEKAAYGIFTIVNSNMVNGIRRVTVERGYDPRDFVLVAGGGATGAHITALAKEMGIDTVIVSKLSSGLCAYGQIISDVKYNYMATIPTRLDSIKAAEKINKTFKEIESKGIEHLNKDGFEEKKINTYRSLEMRYVGQIHECTVNIDFFEITEETLQNIKEAFHNRHEELYTYSEKDSPVELVNIESTIYGRIDRPNYSELENKGQINDALKISRNLIFSEKGNVLKTPVYDGNKLSPGNLIDGPAVVEEDTTTLVIENGWFLELHKSGTYIIKRKKPIS